MRPHSVLQLLQWHHLLLTHFPINRVERSLYVDHAEVLEFLQHRALFVASTPLLPAFVRVDSEQQRALLLFATLEQRLWTISQKEIQDARTAISCA